MPWLHTACMPAVTIRDVPEETRAELAARAARSGRSLQEYLRQTLVELAAQPEVSTLLEEIRERKASTRSMLPSAEILTHRDAGRR